MDEAMTAKQFVAYWLSVDEEAGMTNLDFLEESLAEHRAQFANECALYGDGAPGSALVIAELSDKVAKVRSRLQALQAL